MADMQISSTTSFAAPPRHSNRKRTWLGVLSLAPVACLILAVLGIAVAFAGVFAAVNDFDGTGPTGFGFGFWAAMAFGFISAATSLVAFLVLVIDVFTNPAVDGDRRILWLLVLLFGNVLAFPAYWYVVWWRGSPSGVTAAS
jgi:hypothetical protein